MHASKSSPLLIIRNVALHWPEVNAMGLKLTLAPGSGQETAVVFNPFRINQKGTLECCLCEDHE